MGRPILLFFRFTFKISLDSMYLVIDSITRLAAFWLLTRIMQSSAYLTNFSFRFSSSQSSSFSIMFARSGERFPPCGVPISVSSICSPTMTPLTRNFRINDRTFPSLISLFKIEMSLSWFTVSKNFSKSRSTTQLYPSFIYSTAFSTACWALFPGLKP